MKALFPVGSAKEYVRVDIPTCVTLRDIPKLVAQFIRLLKYASTCTKRG